MKISTRGRYGLRILFELALHSDGPPRMVKDIATAQAISPKYLSRLIIDLRKARLVKSVRGAKGGYKLARFPSDITLLEIVEIMEGRIALHDCVREPDASRRKADCATRQVWSELNEHIRQWMAAVTLQTFLDAHTAREREGLISDYDI